MSNTMAISYRPSSLFSLLIFFALSFSISLAEIRFSDIRSNNRYIIPLDEFGFTHTGRLHLNVSQISLSNPSPDLDLSQVGFILSTRDSWIHVLKQIQDSEITCPLQSRLVKLVYTFDRLKGAKSFDTLFMETEANQFTLAFTNCLEQLQVSMDVRSAMYNLDGKSGRPDYLSSGMTVLPRVYFLFFLIYFSMSVLWIYILYKRRLTAFRIHFFMLALVVLKALNLIYEAEDKYSKSYSKRTGTWNVLLYILLSFLNGITLVALMSTGGGSFLKPHLQEKERKVLMIVVIPLQVFANMAQLVIENHGPYSQDWITWKQVVLLVDIVCCCAVLFPIVRSIKNLRPYYVLVICYIYFSRVVVVYVLVAITSYRYLWTGVVAGELATLAFFAFTGYKFRPEAVHNPYFVIDGKEEEAAAEALK
ncbi:hypothetical protein HHK36_012893 [Tetracentron sinense]|uniref:Uncharacterized protein n=1 Tax=Tetracentron sinense TaxID=13715 RepID=A0A835DIL7_TETSI|nr:hypothetical protein HHK36_012893 [Tetracentron sinense]